MTLPLIDIAGLRLLVMGAGSGIGRAAAEIGAASGARDAATLLPGEVPPQGAALHAPCDVTDPGAVAVAVAGAVAALCGLDAALLTAGIFEHRSLAETAPADWRRVRAINLDGGYHLARAVEPVFRAAGGGSLVPLASQVGIVGHPRATAYAALKGGVIALARTLAIEFAGFGARVNALCPGPVETPMTATARADPARAAGLLAAIPRGRFGRADEIARTALFLASPAAGFVTGHALVADGGVTARWTPWPPTGSRPM